MKKIFLSLILILIGVSTLSGCTKDEILNHYNNVVQSAGSIELTGKLSLQGKKEKGIDDYTGMDGFTVRIENSLLAEALENLDGKKRDVILRYYFLGFDDTEISKILEVNRSTIQRRRHAGLEFIKKFMEDEA